MASLPEWLKKCFRSACSVLHARCGILFYGRLQVTSGLFLSYSALAPLLLDCRWLCSSLTQDSIILLASRPEPGAAWALANVTHKLLSRKGTCTFETQLGLLFGLEEHCGSKAVAPILECCYEVQAALKLKILLLLLHEH